MTLLLLKCQNCGKDFQRHSYRLRGKNNFCSHSCQIAYVSTHQMPAKTKTYTCYMCGKEFTDIACHRKKAKANVFCGTVCRNAHLASKPKEYVHLTCSVCGKEFDRRKSIETQARKKYSSVCCSRKCANTVRNKPDEYIRVVRFIRDARRHFISGNRHIAVSATDDDVYSVWVKQGGRCALTGIQLQLKPASHRGDVSPYQASLDRIDSSKGYTKDNIRFVCAIANYAKRTWDDSILIDFCRKVIDNARR